MMLIKVIKAPQNVIKGCLIGNFIHVRNSIH